MDKNNILQILVFFLQVLFFAEQELLALKYDAIITKILCILFRQELALKFKIYHMSLKDFSVQINLDHVMLKERKSE